MAVLKDLIVHGPSRFINTAQFNSLKVNRIGADEGIFNKLIATNADIGTLNVDDLTAQNATVMGLLDVKGNLHTNSWTNSNIATIQGNFYIAPTVVTGTSSGNTGVTITAINNGSATAGYWTLTISGSNVLTVPNLEADQVVETDQSYNSWSVGSEVMVTGSIKRNNTTYPLGTLKGVLGGSGVTSSGATITKITDNINNNPVTLQECGAGTYGYVEIKISLYKRNYNSALYPLGILLSAQGRASKSFIDIYGGANIAQEGTLKGATTDYGGLSIPNVRIGNLRGLPNIRTGDFTSNNCLPTGWGIYTDNGFFRGKVVAQEGEIGDFILDDNLYSGTGGIGVGDNIYISTGITAPTDCSIANSGGGLDWAFAVGSDFGVTTSGILYAKGARISGSIEITDASNIYTKEDIDLQNQTLSKASISQIEQLEKIINSSDWLAKYGEYTNSYTEDVIPISGKWYFKRDNTGHYQITIPEPNPKLQGWYELKNPTFTRSVDEQVDDGKQYYYRSASTPYFYTPVVNPTGIPASSENAYYELTSTTYQISQDTQVVENKLYFTQETVDSTSVYTVITEPIANPHLLQLYELSDSDETIAKYLSDHLVLSDNKSELQVQIDGTKSRIKLTADSVNIINENSETIAKYGSNIILGKEDDTHINLSSEQGLGFYQGAESTSDANVNRVAYMNGSKLFINSAEIVSELQIGMFKWNTDGASRVSFRYSPK